MIGGTISHCNLMGQCGLGGRYITQRSRPLQCTCAEVQDLVLRLVRHSEGTQLNGKSWEKSEGQG